MLAQFKKRVPGLFKNDLAVDAAVVFVGTSLAGFLNLLYHLVCVRLLSSEEYGTFNALTVLVMFSSMGLAPLTTTFTRFFTEYITKKQLQILILVFKRLLRHLVILGACAFLFIVVCSNFLGGFLKTSAFYIIICGVVILFSFITPPFISALQSFQKFKTLSSIGIISSLVKLIFGFILISAARVRKSFPSFLVTLATVFISFSIHKWAA